MTDSFRYYTRSGLLAHQKQIHHVSIMANGSSSSNDGINSSSSNVRAGSSSSLERSKPSETPDKKTSFSSKYDLLMNRKILNKSKASSSGSSSSSSKSEKCPTCGARFPAGAGGISATSALRAHAKDCAKSRPFACPRCPHRSKTRDKLERHLACHASREMESFRCQHCLKDFVFKNSLKKHLEKGRCAVLKAQKQQQDDKPSKPPPPPANPQQIQHLLSALTSSKMSAPSSEPVQLMMPEVPGYEVNFGT